jgi:dual-specificity kinase
MPRKATSVASKVALVNPMTCVQSVVPPRYTSSSCSSGSSSSSSGSSGSSSGPSTPSSFVMASSGMPYSTQPILFPDLWGTMAAYPSLSCLNNRFPAAGNSLPAITVPYEGSSSNPVIIDDEDDNNVNPNFTVHDEIVEEEEEEIDDPVLPYGHLISASTALPYIPTLAPTTTKLTKVLRNSTSSLLPPTSSSSSSISLAVTATTTSRKRSLNTAMVPSTTVVTKRPTATTAKAQPKTARAATSKQTKAVADSSKKRVCTTETRTRVGAGMPVVSVANPKVIVNLEDGNTSSATANPTLISTAGTKPLSTSYQSYLHYQQHHQQFCQPLLQHQAFPCTLPQQQLREHVLHQLYSRKMRAFPHEEVLDDKRGHLRITFGNNLTPRYKILDFLGEGTFAKVVECWDRLNNIRVAIKVVRSLQKYRDAALMELNTLAAISERDPEHSQPCVQYREWFEYGGHICIVFEKLGMSLYEFLRENGFKPLQPPNLKLLATQIIQGVAFLHGELDLIHTDLKPENILFVVPGLSDRVSLFYSSPLHPPSFVLPLYSQVQKPKQASNKIVLIDFGSATFDYQYHTSIVSTRQYRSPEVILGSLPFLAFLSPTSRYSHFSSLTSCRSLGLGWTFPCDIWSVGCILMELYTGEALFQTHDNIDHLAMMERVLGALPRTLMTRATPEAQQFFQPFGTVRWPTTTTEQGMVRKVKRLVPLRVSTLHLSFFFTSSLATFELLHLSIFPSFAHTSFFPFSSFLFSRTSFLQTTQISTISFQRCWCTIQTRG